jgi:hypothetical protein
MSDRNHDNLDERQRLAREAVRSLDRPAADPDFRARLKSQFVAGRIPASKDAPGLAVVDGTRAAVETPVAPPRRNRAVWGGLAAAAVVAFVFFFNTAKLPGPELVAAAGSGPVTVDGVRYGADNPEALGRALVPGARVVVGDGARIDLAYPGTFAMRVDQGTDIVLPARPGRWTGRSIRAVMARGEISVRTGPELAGGELHVLTGEADAVIRGTLVSVVSNEKLTCICLFEGTTDVLADGRDLGRLPPGKRWVVYSDGSEPELKDIAPPHLEHMQEFDGSLK